MASPFGAAGIVRTVRAARQVPARTSESSAGTAETAGASSPVCVAPAGTARVDPACRSWADFGNIDPTDGTLAKSHNGKFDKCWDGS